MKTEDKKLFIHISDIHISENTTNEDLKLNKFISAIARHRYLTDNLTFLVTGDIAQSGNKKEYENAYLFFQEIKETLLCKHNFSEINFCFCPGNHDLDFSQNSELREYFIKEYKSKKEINEIIIKEITKTQDNFFDFLENLYDRKISGINRIFWYENLKHQEDSISIYSCNTSITSNRKEKQGDLCLIAPHYEKSSTENITITLTHHPDHWGNNDEYKIFRNNIRKNSDFLLTGHEHEFSSFDVVSNEYSCTIVESGVFWAPYDHTSSFNIIYIDKNEFDLIELKFNKDINSYVSNHEIQTTNLRKITGKKNNRLEEKFHDFLNDAGADFSHPRKEKIEINDIYIWPDLRHENSKSLNVLKQDSKNLINTNYKNKIIVGSELSGKTSLAKNIFSQRIKDGKHPIYIDCKSFNPTGNHISDFKYQAKNSYGSESEKISLKDNSEKILIIDNFEKLAKRKNFNIGEFLIFSKHFASEIIIFSLKSLEELSLLDDVQLNSIGDFESYNILEFGPTKRYDLAKKWTSIGKETQDILQNDHHFDSIEKDLQTAVGKKLIPSYPIFLLTLIQASESRSAPDLKGSAFGHYYQYLITNSLGKAGINQQQYDEFFHFCSILANDISSKSNKELSEEDFSNLIKKYSDSFLRTSQYNRIKDLKSANILTELVDEKGASYRFKYPYLYYFFLGKYLSDNLKEECEKVKYLSKNLHLSDNAHTLLFLSHFTKDKIVYESILHEIKNCFEEFIEFDIQHGSSLINKLVNDIDYKKIELTINDDRDLRRDLRESEENHYTKIPTHISAAPVSQDSINSITLHDELNVSEITNWSSRVNKLFRSIEIMGQFIKNHYGSTKHETKNEIIKELISSALRGLESFISKCDEEKISIPLMVERILEDEISSLSSDEKSIRLRQASFNIIGMISYAFINKVASALASEFIIENLNGVTEESENSSYKLIDLAQNFELPKKLSFEKVEYLSKNFEKNVFAINMLRTLAYRHLHLYKIDYKERQKLSNTLDIPIKSQRIAADKRI